MTETVSPPAEAKGKRRPRRTGAADAGTMDRIGITRLATVLLSLAVAGGAVGSIEGLLHAGGWAEPDELIWTLPLSVDVFLVGTMLAHLQLRERRAYWAAGFVLAATIVLVAFSATMNFLYVRSANPPGSMEYEVGAFIKGSMPVLLLVALEIIAALKSTRNNRANSPLNRAKAELKKSRARVRELEKAGKQEAKAARRGKATSPAAEPEQLELPLVPAGVDGDGLIRFGTFPVVSPETAEATR